MSQSIKLQAVGREDRNNKIYYFTRPNLPASVDLSQAIIFIHPWEKDGETGADIVIKQYEEGVGSNKRAVDVD